MKFLRNALTAIRHPSHLVGYGVFQVKRLLHPTDGATLRLPWGDTIGGFINYSEYRSTPAALEQWEMLFLTRFAELSASQGHNGVQGHILDVGANIGVTALHLSYLYPDNEVVGFEPAESTYSSFVSNVKRNAHRNIVVEQLAICDQPGHLYLSRPAGRANAHISDEHDAGAERVVATTLDLYSELHGISRIKLLKIDTEGYESAVLKGAQGLLAKGAIDCVYFEFCPALELGSGTPVGSAVRILNESHFSVFEIDKNGYLCSLDVNRFQLPELCNLVAILTDRLPGHRSLFERAAG